MAFGLFCLTAFVIVGWVLHDHSHAVALPAFTGAVFRWRYWLLLCPIPWLSYAVVLSREKDLSSVSALRYAGSAALGLAIIVYVVVVAALLPYTVLRS